MYKVVLLFFSLSGKCSFVSLIAKTNCLEKIQFWNIGWIRFPLQSVVFVHHKYEIFLFFFKKAATKC